MENHWIRSWVKNLQLVWYLVMYCGFWLPKALRFGNPKQLRIISSFNLHKLRRNLKSETINEGKGSFTTTSREAAAHALGRRCCRDDGHAREIEAAEGSGTWPLGLYLLPGGDYLSSVAGAPPPAAPPWCDRTLMSRRRRVLVGSTEDGFGLRPVNQKTASRLCGPLVTP